MSYVVIERQRKNPNNLIFNDHLTWVIDELDKEYGVLSMGVYAHQQVCDSKADAYITKGRKWSKAKGNPDAYTLAPGVYLLKKGSYKKTRPGIIIKNPVTILGFVKFTLHHLIHRTNLPPTGIAEMRTARDGQKYKLGPSGGCCVLPRLKYDLFDAIKLRKDISYPSHLKIVEVD